MTKETFEKIVRNQLLDYGLGKAHLAESVEEISEAAQNLDRHAVKKIRRDDEKQR